MPRPRRLAILALALLPILAGSSALADARSNGSAPGDVPPAPYVAPASWSRMCDAVAPAGTPLVTGTNCRWLAFDGVWRRYVVEVPDPAAWPRDRAWPTVMMLHGAGTDGERMWRLSGWVEQARAVGAIVIFPTAWRYLRLTGHVATRWNTWALPDEIDPSVRVDGYPHDAPYPARDIAFVRAMFDDVAGQRRVDPARVHASGFSNGGKFVNRVAAELSEIASVTCSGFCDAPPSNVHLDRPVPMLYGLGARDPRVLKELAEHLEADPVVVPLTWGAARPVIWSLLVDHLRANNLDRRPTRIVARDTSLSVVWRQPRVGDRPTARFRFLLMGGLGHRYPADTSPGRSSFAAISWAFFRQNPLE